MLQVPASKWSHDRSLLDRTDQAPTLVSSHDTIFGLFCPPSFSNRSCTRIIRAPQRSIPSKPNLRVPQNEAPRIQYKHDFVLLHADSLEVYMLTGQIVSESPFLRPASSSPCKGSVTCHVFRPLRGKPARKADRLHPHHMSGSMMNPYCHSMSLQLECR
jgi:hypothetical protein